MTAPYSVQTEAKYNIATLVAKNNNMSVLPKPCINISLILFFKKSYEY